MTENCLTLHRASNYSKISKYIIRKAIEDNELRAEKVDGKKGQEYKILSSDLNTWLSVRADVKIKEGRETKSIDLPKTSTVIESVTVTYTKEYVDNLVSDLRDQIGWLRSQNEKLNEQTTQLMLQAAQPRKKIFGLF